MKAAFLKCLFLTTVVGLTLLSGCARQYTVTLNNGTRMQVIGKPKLVEGSYVSKDANGQEVRISRTRVREIAPSSMAGARQSSGFSAAPEK